MWPKTSVSLAPMVAFEGKSLKLCFHKRWEKGLSLWTAIVRKIERKAKGESISSGAGLVEGLIDAKDGKLAKDAEFF